jgi:hypothetical protein
MSRGRKNKKVSRKKNKRSTRNTRNKRRQSGGGTDGGAGWGFSVDPEMSVSNNPLAFSSIGSCRGTDGGAPVVRPGFLGNFQPGPGGLPGMSGGRRKRTRKNRKNQRGGRYAADFTPEVYGPQGGMMPVMSIPCEGSRTAIPAPMSSGQLNTRDSYLWDGPKGTAGDIPSQFGGGAYQGADAASASPYEIVPTARYTQLEKPSDIIQTAAGTNVMINTPINNKEWTTTCLKPLSGGRRKKNGTTRKNRKQKNKKSRKNRKNRK